MDSLDSGSNDAFMDSFHEAVANDTTTDIVDNLAGTVEKVPEAPEEGAEAVQDDGVDLEAALAVLDDEPADEGEEGYEEESFVEEESEEEASDGEEAVSSHEEQVAMMLEPIKVGDIELNIESMEEARRLMQVGLEAQKRLVDSQPQRKIAAMLEAQGLTDPDKLNHMIDVFNKKPEAIAKFLKDADIDPMDLDTDSEVEYQPEDHSVSDGQTLLQDVLNEVKSSPSGQATLDNVQKWDSKSVDFLVQNPNSLKMLNQHVASGVYAQVMSEVSKRKIFGDVAGIPDYELYHQVGTELAEKGAFSDKKETPSKVDTSKITPLSKTENQRKTQKKASKAPKGKPARQVDVDSLFDLSDEDYLKVIHKAIS